MTVITGRKAGIKITFVGLFLVRRPVGGDSVLRLSSNLAGRRWHPISYSLPKIKIFGGHLGNAGPENPQKLPNNLEITKKIIFTLCISSACVPIPVFLSFFPVSMSFLSVPCLSV